MGFARPGGPQGYDVPVTMPDQEAAMTLKRLALASLAMLTVLGCASSLKTRQEPEQARSSIAAVLRANGFDQVDTKEESGVWRIVAERRQGFELTEKRYAIEQAPTMQMDPVNNNMTTFEERIDPSKYTLTERVETVSYRAEIAVPKAGPERAVSVSVTGTVIPASNKFREILWKTSEPPSARLVEEALTRSLEKTL
jgi:hypothetical protein